MSSRPKRDIACSNACLICASSRTSARTNAARAPAFSIILTVSSPSCWLTSTSNRLAPLAASIRAVVLPIPETPPVIRAVLPLISILMMLRGNRFGVTGGASLWRPAGGQRRPPSGILQMILLSRPKASAQVVELHRVVAGDLLDHGRGESLHVFLNVLARVGPGAVRMGIVRRPDYVVFADLGNELQADVILFEAYPNVLAEKLAWLGRQLHCVPEQLFVFVVHAAQQVGNPAQSSLCQNQAQLGLSIERAAENDLAQGFVQLHRQRRDQRGDLPAPGVEAGVAHTAAQVEAQYYAVVRGRGPERLPGF